MTILCLHVNLKLKFILTCINEYQIYLLAHLKGSKASKEEYPARGFIVVSMDSHPRKTEDGIEILPWKVFLE
jgi:hypothetical protein